MTHTTKHTPGPWKCNREGLITKDDRYGLHIAQVATVGMGYAIQPNAHLIAAAPAMYEALSRLRNVASTASNHMRLSGNEEEALLFDNDQRVVEAALAQAEGKS